jgi:hypothetical protein
MSDAESIGAEIEEFGQKVAEALAALRQAEAEGSLSDDVLRAAWETLAGVRAELELIPVFYSRAENEGRPVQLRWLEAELDPEMEQQLDDEVDSVLADIDDAVVDYDLVSSVAWRTVPDAVLEAPKTLASRPVGEEVRALLSAYADTAIPPREYYAALDELLMFVDTESPDADESWQGFLANAHELATDFLVHDWRWAEGQSLIDRFTANTPVGDDEQRSALSVLQGSHFDLYRVDDVDSDRGILHLERTFDNASLDIEVDEDLVALIGPGDGIIGRIYQWSDGPELGSWLPVEADMMPTVEEWFAQAEGDARAIYASATRAMALKHTGQVVLTELLGKLARDAGHGDGA